jgi:hypothetical protein
MIKSKLIYPIDFLSANQMVKLRSNSDVICKKIFELDEKIRSARIINSKGKLVAGGMKPGLKSLEDAKKDQMLFRELSLGKNAS